MKNTFFSLSFGCRVNQAEKEDFDQKLIESGFFYSKEKPDIYIINSCSITKKAEREVKQLINQISKKQPKTQIIVTGCGATNWIKLNKNLNNKVWLINNSQKDYLLDIIKKRLPTVNYNKKTFFNQVVLDKYQKSKRAILKIQDGCHRFCSYCIVPYLRGKPKSVPINFLVNKIKAIEDNVNEVILTAINTESYGQDINQSFVDLIEDIIKKTKIKRFSFGSIHPWSINNDFVNLYKKLNQNKKWVDFFHIPLQSGSNKILQLMKRGYTKEEFLEKINSLYNLNPSIFFGTDIIVGFLGETDKEFQETFDFLKHSPISKFHVFRYSIREHTAGYYLSKRFKLPSDKIVKKRALALRNLGQKKYYRFLEKQVDKMFETMFISKFNSDFQQGLLTNQLPVYVRTKKDFTGKFFNVKIERVINDQLIGKIV